MLVSDVSAASPWVNFGLLGDTQRFDLPSDDAIPGVYWLMPRPSSNTSSD